MSLSSWFTRFTFDPFVTLENSSEFSVAETRQKKWNISSIVLYLHAGETRISAPPRGTSVRTLKAKRLCVRSRRSRPGWQRPNCPNWARLVARVVSFSKKGQPAHVNSYQFLALIHTRRTLGKNTAQQVSSPTSAFG